MKFELGELFGIRERRKHLNLTQAQLAERMGVGEDYSAFREREERHKSRMHSVVSRPLAIRSRQSG
ncbi:MAG: helix-turn-helix domain-containing protein [Bryobacteraceae bacterium]